MLIRGVLLASVGPEKRPRVAAALAGEDFEEDAEVDGEPLDLDEDTDSKESIPLDWTRSATVLVAG